MAVVVLVAAEKHSSFKTILMKMSVQPTAAATISSLSALSHSLSCALQPAQSALRRRRRRRPPPDRPACTINTQPSHFFVPACLPEPESEFEPVCVCEDPRRVRGEATLSAKAGERERERGSAAAPTALAAAAATMQPKECTE